MRGSALRRLYPVLGVIALVVLVEVVGRFELAGKSWPPLTEVLASLGQPGRLDLVLRSLGATAVAAAAGLVLGTVLATAGAALGLLVPVARPGMDRLAAILNAVPLIALAPLLIMTVGREGTPTVIAALGVGFVMFVALSSGLLAASRTHQDVFTVLGAARLTRLRRLQFPAALPYFLDGLALAGPTAVLGATIGEWFGAPSGLGVLIVSAMQNFQIPLLWSAALSATLLSLLAYVLFSRVQVLAARRFA
ncbi:ABC transporter permease [Naasia sp. SYSU D00948]|uniref:ABC transporter permease n=1 Tax=Naasia sp. SYSU D00948 TaxID=2817379 RepID=UPI001B3140D7|nr:ABC transporter permease subunit [Naasia sp. SYSU D00948]